MSISQENFWSQSGTQEYEVTIFEFILMNRHRIVAGWMGYLGIRMTFHPQFQAEGRPVWTLRVLAAEAVLMVFPLPLAEIVDQLRRAPMTYVALLLPVGFDTVWLRKYLRSTYEQQLSIWQALTKYARSTSGQSQSDEERESQEQQKKWTADLTCVTGLALALLLGAFLQS